MDLDDDELKATRILNGVEKNTDRCKYCGGIIEQPKRGRKRDYCKKPECIRKMRNEANKKWYAKKMKTLKGAKSRIVEQKEEKTVIYSSKDKADTKAKMADIGDILQLARDFGSCRYNLVQALQKEQVEEKKYNKVDQTFLHKLEFLEELTDEEATTMIIEEKKSREQRRNVKNRKHLIEAMLNSIKMKNPNAFVVQAIQSKGDILKTMAKLKQDDDLYDKN